MSSASSRLEHLRGLAQRPALVIDFEGASDRTPRAVGLAVVDSNGNPLSCWEFVFRCDPGDYSASTLQWWKSQPGAHKYLLDREPATLKDSVDNEAKFLAAIDEARRMYPDAVLVADAVIYDWGVMLDGILRKHGRGGSQKAFGGKFRQPYELHTMQLLVDVPEAPAGMHTHKPMDDCLAIAWRWRRGLSNVISLLSGSSSA